MTLLKQGSCLYIFALMLSIITLFSCSKENILENITGDYCSYREAPTGHVSSSVNISVDTTELYDLIISNISGFDNTSEAYKDIGLNRINNQLIIPDHTVLVGNSDSRTITAEGTISENGSIELNINSRSEMNEDSYILFLNNSSSFNYYSSFTGPGQSLNLQENQILLSVTTEEEELLDFTIIESDNLACQVTIERQFTVEQISGETFIIEADIHFKGTQVFGTLKYSPNSWQNAKTIELMLE